MSDLPIAAVQRIAKMNGAERIGADAVTELVKLAETYIGKISKDAAALAGHANRKTVNVEDIKMAIQK